MTKFVRDFVEVPEYSSLDALIDTLVSLRDGLPPGSEATLRLQGDDIFGRKLSISYLRSQTAEEAECDARYAGAYQQSRERLLADLHVEVGASKPPLSLAA